MEQHAVFQALAESFVGGMFQAGAVELGRFVFGRGHAVVELAVVRNQQNAGGVGIQASDGLHVDVAHVVGKQAEHARIIARFVRSFVIGRFVQYDIKVRLGNGLNGFAVDVQGADFRRIDFAFAVVADFAVDGNAVVINQPLALFAAAQSLGLQIFEQLHDYRVMFSDGLNYAKEGRLKKGGKKNRPCYQGRKRNTNHYQNFYIIPKPDRRVLPQDIRRVAGVAGTTRNQICR